MLVVRQFMTTKVLDVPRSAFIVFQVSTIRRTHPFIMSHHECSSQDVNTFLFVILHESCCKLFRVITRVVALALACSVTTPLQSLMSAFLMAYTTEPHQKSFTLNAFSLFGTDEVLRLSLLGASVDTYQRLLSKCCKV